MRLLLTPKVMLLLENILEFKVGGSGKWKIYLQKKDREACTKEKTSFRNLMVDADNPNKYLNPKTPKPHDFKKYINVI